MKDTTQLRISYDAARLTGRIIRDGEGASAIWDRLRTRAAADEAARIISDREIEFPWSDTLEIVREHGTRASQRAQGFRFAPEGEAVARIQKFLAELKQARASRNSLTLTLSRDEIEETLIERGFRRRKLKEFQLRDLERLASLSHGANFSVPGAGKTTVAFALHVLTRTADTVLFVVGPKAAFPAWREIVGECMDADAPNDGAEQFTVLDGRVEDTDRLLASGASRFLMSYDLMVRQQDLITNFFSRRKVHLILDESHRMKAGLGSQRGAFLLRVAPLLARRDILTGTPMPQAASDMSSQLGFLWPGLGLDARIQRGDAPRAVLGNLYVRTTKSELGLPPARRHYYDVGMAPGQMALYGLVRDESLRQLQQAIGRSASQIDVLGARRSVMRLLQLSANPVLALQAMTDVGAQLSSGVVDRVLEEGASTKMRAVADHARDLARGGKKTVIWTIFTATIGDMERMLADLNSLTLYGAIPVGEDTDENTREGRLRRFHEDPACRVLIANPAAAGEGISLHTVCHNAIYLDRSYVSTHFLQSIDRIHRLGLPPGVDTNIHIYRTRAPAGLGSIDLSVSRRLAAKLRNLQRLLNDPDLHEVALDEENADDPVDYDVDLQDLTDLVAELEGAKENDDEEQA